MKEDIVYVVLTRDWDAEKEEWWTLDRIFRDKQKAEEYAQESSKRVYGYDKKDPDYICEEWSIE